MSGHNERVETYSDDGRAMGRPTREELLAAIEMVIDAADDDPSANATDICNAIDWSRLRELSFNKDEEDER